jgi:predicted small secreted protein
MDHRIWILAVLFALTQTGCNTVRGAGEDVGAAGDAISDTAQDAEDELED